MTPLTASSYLGLAPFLRASIAGTDMRALAQELLALAETDQDKPSRWMNLATVFLCIGLRDLGLQMQRQGLQMQRTYELPAAQQPARLRLLMLMAPGDLAENTPLDCLLEGSGIDLVLHFASMDAPLPPPDLAHDVLMVAMSDTEDTRPLLQALHGPLGQWSKPVINMPQAITHTERSTASALLQGVPGLLMPPTWTITRQALQAIAQGGALLGEVVEGCEFPIIVRPVGSHAGKDLEKIDDAAGMARYLDAVGDAAFYLSRFIDYSGPDGLFRKYRVALIAGQPFASHMGVSSHWMIHYVNAGMYDDAAKRAEEAAFMEHFDAFAQKHRTVLAAIYERSGLDYVCVDCAQTQTGELLVFEIDHAMVVHAMDPVDLFPYKQVHMRKVRQAFEDYLVQVHTTGNTHLDTGRTAP